MPSSAPSPAFVVPLIALEPPQTTVEPGEGIPDTLKTKFKVANAEGLMETRHTKEQIPEVPPAIPFSWSNCQVVASYQQIGKVGEDGAVGYRLKATALIHTTRSKLFGKLFDFGGGT